MPLLSEQQFHDSRIYETAVVNDNGWPLLHGDFVCHAFLASLKTRLPDADTKQEALLHQIENAKDDLNSKQQDDRN